MHTNYSDGVLSPKLLIDKCINLGLKIISITDHDSTLAFNEIKNFDLQNQIEIIPGIELSASFGNYEAHILGYFINPNDKYLLQALNDFRSARKTRAYKIGEKLNKIGVKIDIDNLIFEIENENKYAAIGRAHIARKIIELGYAETNFQVFDKFIGNNSVAFVPKPHFTINETVELIKNSGGVSFLAHPGRNIEDTILDTILKSGIDGVEVKHPSHKKYVEKFYRNLAGMKGLLISGGSDFHGANLNDENNLGKFGITEHQLNKIKKLAELRKS